MTVASKPIGADLLLAELARKAGVLGDAALLKAELERRQLTLHDGPLLVRGVLPQAMVAVVGARASDPYGLELARKLAMELVARGIAVVSGGAEGCDGAAHLGALDAHGQTVVVLPAGHDHLYPEHHAPLFERVVAQGGALVSAYWPTTRIARHQFLARNRVIARLAPGGIVAPQSPAAASADSAR